MRRFDPAEMARLETAMWRDYYEKRYVTLFYHLYESSRAQFAEAMAYRDARGQKMTEEGWMAIGASRRLPMRG